MKVIGLILENKKTTKNNKNELTLDKIKEILKENGIEFDEKAKKQDLLDLLPKKV